MPGNAVCGCCDAAPAANSSPTHQTVRIRSTPVLVQAQLASAVKQGAHPRGRPARVRFNSALRSRSWTSEAPLACGEADLPKVWVPTRWRSVKVPSWISIGLGITTLGLAAALGVVASSGPTLAPTRVTVPRLVGVPEASQASVRTQVRDVGLLLNLTTLSRCDEHGQGPGVLSQSPAPGTSVDAASTVSVIWSTVFCH